MGIFPPISKKIEGREKERRRKVTYLLFKLHLITFNLTGSELLVFYHYELSTFRNKTYRFICRVEKIKKDFMGCKKDIGCKQNVNFKHLFDSCRLLTSFMFDYIFSSF